MMPDQMKYQLDSRVMFKKLVLQQIFPRQRMIANACQNDNNKSLFFVLQIQRSLSIHAGQQIHQFIQKTVHRLNVHERPQ